MVAFQQGNSTAFEQLLDKYHRPIVNFIYKIVNNAAEAEELAQEVFLRIYRARAQLRAEGEIRRLDLPDCDQSEPQGSEPEASHAFLEPQPQLGRGSRVFWRRYCAIRCRMPKGG